MCVRVKLSLDARNPDSPCQPHGHAEDEVGSMTQLAEEEEEGRLTKRDEESRAASVLGDWIGEIYINKARLTPHSLLEEVGCCL